jgi:hypothetical protein
MRSRSLLLAMLVCLAVALPLAAAKATKKPAAAPQAGVAPDELSHPIAMFLAHLSNEQKITFRATAQGERFFLEVPAGVTVYAFDGTSSYRKTAFHKGLTLAQALKKYPAAKNAR